MALPNPFRRLKAETSTVDDLSAELGRLDSIRLDAQNALHDLGAKRPGLLLDATGAALAKHDEAMTAARRAIEQAEARIAVITPEWQEADRRETAARLDRECRDRYASAVKARAEGVKLVAVYRSQASAMAETLRRLVGIEAEIEAANLDLPADAAPIGGAEPFNGRHATPDTWPEIEVWAGPDGVHHGHAVPGSQPPFRGAKRVVTRGFASIPGSPGLPHRPIGSRVALPAVDPTAAPYWAPGVAAPRRSGEAEAFLLQRGFRR